MRRKYFLKLLLSLLWSEYVSQGQVFFVEPVVALWRQVLEKYNFVLLHLPIPQETITKNSFLSGFKHVVFPADSFFLISNFSVGSVGSTSVGLFLCRFCTWIPFFANTAISNFAAHLDHSSGGSAEAFPQNGLMFSGFFENPAGCAISNPFVTLKPLPMKFSRTVGVGVRSSWSSH